MQEKSKRLSKRAIYLILLAVTFVTIAIIVTVAIVNSNKTQLEAEKPKTSVSSSSTSNSQSSPEPDQSDIPTPDKPTVTEIVFDMPVSGGSVITEYTAATVVYNKTLGIYTGHMGIDIGGNENAQVVCCYDGVVKDIATAYLTGTTVTIDHGEGLMTIYNSIEPIDTLKVGDTLKKGDAIGVISTNNRQEYKDGAHLHFEVHENGKNVDPYKYIAVVGK